MMIVYQILHTHVDRDDYFLIIHTQYKLFNVYNEYNGLNVISHSIDESLDGPIFVNNTSEEL
jgi:hypothetical protein